MLNGKLLLGTYSTDFLNSGIGFGDLNHTAGSIRRGGSYAGGDQNGIFYMSLSVPTNNIDSSRGFRCVHIP